MVAEGVSPACRHIVRSETYDWGVFYQKPPTSVVAKNPPNLAIMHSWAIQRGAADRAGRALAI